MLTKEVDDLREALAVAAGRSVSHATCPYEPKLTVIVARKRHNTRIFNVHPSRPFSSVD